MLLNETIFDRPVIIGAGPAGAACALFLAQAGTPSILLDKAIFPRDKICGDALSGKVVEVLRKLDPILLDDLDADPIQVGAWGVEFVAPNGKHLRVPFRTHMVEGSRPPGYMSRRVDFDNFLMEQVRKQPLIEVREGWHLKTATQVQDCIQLDFAGGQQLTASLAIGADGAHSVLAKQLAHFKLEPRHYCGGIRAYYTGVSWPEAGNYVELHFLQEVLPGYLWVFPLPDGRANVGIGMRTDKISARHVNLKTELERLLQAIPALRERFANARLEGPVTGFGLPLGSKKRPLSGNNYLLLGDAGSLIDPFTGEGIGNALFSAMFAASQAEVSLKTKDFSAATLKAYDRAVYHRLWGELRLGSIMQQLVTVPWLFNLVVNKAQKSPTLRQTISAMFDDINLRQRLKTPAFYFDLLFN